MNVGSLFSGIGGLDLGLERAGMTVRWQSEIDPYACRVLAKHWPDVPNLGDIRHVDWSTIEPVDLVCGGYPCQPFSYAGARGGDTDARHLWPAFARCLRELRPRWALLENVPGHLSLGFGRVLGDLAELGFDAEWDCIPAAAVGAPHLRYRVFVVAHTDSSAGIARGFRRTDRSSSSAVAHANGQGEPGVTSDERRTLPRPVVSDAVSDGVRQQPVAFARSGGASIALVDGEERAVADADEVGRRRRAGMLGSRGRRESEDGGWWATEPDVGRVAHGIPARVDRLRTLGNAVVPQVAEWVGRRIMEAAA